MWRWCWLVAGCLPSGYEAEPPAPREREVLVQAIPGGTVIYQDGDGPWQLAPRVGERYGFDVDDERYGVAVVDVARQRVDTLYATVTNHPDVEWHLPQTSSETTHILSGTVSGLDARGGRIAGRLRGELLLATSDPTQGFALELDEGLQTVAFGRRGTGLSETIDMLIVRRNVAIVGDRIESIDFATEGSVTERIPVTQRGPSPLSCSILSFFHFDATLMILGNVASTAIAPAAELWRAEDHLELRLSCASGDNFRTVFFAAPTPAAIPASLEAPSDLGLVSLTSAQQRFRFEWEPYAKPITGYTASLRAVDAVRPIWSVEISNEWLADRESAATVLSPRDLDALSLQEPSIELQGRLSWSFAAVGADDRTSFAAGVFGIVEAP